MRDRRHLQTFLDRSAPPGGQVWRKRLHRVGPAEAGQVTSVVRYLPGARFHSHPHPDGEEILVLEGQFGDEHGIAGPGSFLLHPEGFEHAPYSEDGCLLFVKLRQYTGAGREYVTRDTAAMDWTDSPWPDIEWKTLYADERLPDITRLERWAGGAEFFVLDGAFADADGSYGNGVWLRLPPGAFHHPYSETGCTLYVKTGGVAGLLAES